MKFNLRGLNFFLWFEKIMAKGRNIVLKFNLIKTKIERCVFYLTEDCSANHEVRRLEI